MKSLKRFCLKKYIPVLVLFLGLLCFNKIGVNAAVSVITQSRLSTDSATVNWTRITGAKVYYLGIGEDETEAKNSALSHALSFEQGTLSHTFTGLKPGMKYTVVLRYVRDGKDGQKEDQAGSAIIKTLPGKISGLTQTRWYANKKKVYVGWNEQNAGNYRYVFMDKAGKRIKSGELFTNSFSSRIDDKKCYSFKVKSVAIINGKTYEGEWSDRIFLFAQPMIKSYNYGNDFDLGIKNKRLVLKWDKSKYVNAGYKIYVSKNRDKGYVKVASVGKKKTSAVVKKFKGSSFKHSGTYYVYVEGIRKYAGKISSTGIGYVWEYKNGKVRQTYYHGDY